MILTLAAQIKKAVAQATNISTNEVNRRLAKVRRSPGSHLIIAPAARMFWEQLRVVKPETLHERVLVENWVREFNWSDGDDATEDPTENWELEDWAYVQYELRPGEVSGFLSRQDTVNPYEDKEDHTDFYIAQHGGVPLQDDGNSNLGEDIDRNREPEGWPEYMRPVGHIDVYNGYAWEGMLYATQVAVALTQDWFELNGWALEQMELQREEMDPGDYVSAETLMYVDIIRKSDSFPQFVGNLKIEKLSTWDMVRFLIREDVEAAWKVAVCSYNEHQMNVIGLALVAHRLTSITRFDIEEMLERAALVQWRSHADDETHLGTLGDFLVEYKGDLDELEEDLPQKQNTALEPWEEQELMDVLAQTYEKDMHLFWEEQFNHKDARFAACWTGTGDVNYSVAYRAAILDGQEGIDAHSVALNARRGG